MALALLGGLFGLSFAFWSLSILSFAFRRSLGTGVMVLLIPAYIFYFAFTQFEHARKSLIVSLWLSSLGLSAVFFGLVDASLRGALPPFP